MKARRCFITALILFTAIVSARAQSLSLDSLVHILNNRSEILKSQLEIGQMDVTSYTIGTSHCTKTGLASKLIPHLLPFSTNPQSDVALEAFSHIQYQWPGDMQLNVTSMQTNQQRKGKQLMSEILQGLLPIYAIRRRNDYGSNKSYTLPFYEQGTKRYNYNFRELTDSILIEAQTHGTELDFSHVCCIEFHPKRNHHTLLDGYVLLDSVSKQIVGLKWKGKLDMARFTGQLYFVNDTVKKTFTPHCSEINIDYRYAKTRAHNNYHTIFRDFSITSFDSIDRHNIPLNLTPYYQNAEPEEVDFEKQRPIYLPKYVDSLLYDAPPSAPRRHRKKLAIESFSETLVDGAKIGPEQNRLRIYGPISPEVFGYDKFNGFTMRERARWIKRYPDNRQLYLRGEIGYAFGLKELRYKTFMEYTYNPAKRGYLKFEIQRNNSTFSSKFINSINDELSKEHKSINFDSLGIDYYKRREIRIEHGLELTNGLMFYSGILTTFRTPVKQGTRAIPEWKRRQLVDSYYADFAPYIRMEWTPEQYYYYNRGYKEYLNSPAPTIAFEFSRAIPGALNSDSNYGRMELDISQSLHIGRTRILAYHLGAGRFFNQKGEYFINYRYFSRSQYPTSWEDDRIGGTFHLLDEPWYSSSPNYLQGHFMHETPFGLLHYIPFLSSYIIKERVYLGSLLATHKQFYNEIGYGIDNNYFNIGFFIGFREGRYFSNGFKVRLEIGRHI